MKLTATEENNGQDTVVQTLSDGILLFQRNGQNRETIFLCWEHLNSLLKLYATCKIGE